MSALSATHADMVASLVADLAADYSRGSRLCDAGRSGSIGAASGQRQGRVWGGSEHAVRTRTHAARWRQSVTVSVIDRYFCDGTFVCDVCRPVACVVERRFTAFSATRVRSVPCATLDLSVGFSVLRSMPIRPTATLVSAALTRRQSTTARTTTHHHAPPPPGTTRHHQAPPGTTSDQPRDHT